MPGSIGKRLPAETVDRSPALDAIDRLEMVAGIPSRCSCRHGSACRASRSPCRRPRAGAGGSPGRPRDLAVGSIDLGERANDHAASSPARRCRCRAARRLLDTLGDDVEPRSSSSSGIVSGRQNLEHLVLAAGRLDNHAPFEGRPRDLPGRLDVGKLDALDQPAAPDGAAVDRRRSVELLADDPAPPLHVFGELAVVPEMLERRRGGHKGRGCGRGTCRCACPAPTGRAPA